MGTDVEELMKVLDERKSEQMSLLDRAADLISFGRNLSFSDLFSVNSSGVAITIKVARRFE